MEIFSIFMSLDEKDLVILKILKENSKLTSSQISKETRIPITTIHNRIKKLENSSIIKKYTVKINYEKIGKPLKAYILVTANQHPLNNKKISQEEIGKKIKMVEDVDYVDIITGVSDLIVQIRASTMKELNNFITEKLRNVEGVERTQTLMVLKEM
jgi:Lrp/AsnC family transcriptional regulator, leucine-responsive regulatory protein